MTKTENNIITTKTPTTITQREEDKTIDTIKTIAISGAHGSGWVVILNPTRVPGWVGLNPSRVGFISCISTQPVPSRVGFGLNPSRVGLI